jgi:hypothetical protein
MGPKTGANVKLSSKYLTVLAIPFQQSRDRRYSSQWDMGCRYSFYKSTGRWICSSACCGFIYAKTGTAMDYVDAICSSFERLGRNI